MHKINNRQYTRQVRLKEWKKVFQARNESGLSVKAFCEANNISKDKYFYWMGIARQEQIKQADNQLVQLPNPETLPSEVSSYSPVGILPSPTTIKLHINGVDVTVDQDTTPAMLKMVIGVIKDA